MSDRTYYCLCEDNCRFETLNREGIYDAIAEATGTTPTPVDEAFITMIKEQNANQNIKVWKGTAAQYNALETTSNNTLYFIDTNEIRDYETEINEIAEDVSDLDDRFDGVQSKTLVWTNASPSSRFNAQNVSLDLSSYNGIGIIFRTVDQQLYYKSLYMELYDLDKDHAVSYSMQSGSDGNINSFDRPVTPHNDYIYFNKAKISYSGGNTENNKILVPYKIYGIKGA